MELQDTPFIKFMVNSWIKYERFKGASRICAIFLNFLLLLFKLIFCGIGLLVMAPHLGANHLLSKYNLSIPQKLLYALLVIVSLILDIPIMLIALFCVIAGIEFMSGIFTNIFMIIPTAVFGGIAVLLGKVLIIFVTSLFSKPLTDTVEEDTEYEEDYEPQPDIEDSDYDELAFCQLFTIGTEMCLLINHIEMCPDETAFIRVVDDEGYTPLYKRKVRRDKGGNRFIVFNSTHYYLDDKKTQPIITKK